MCRDHPVDCQSEGVSTTLESLQDHCLHEPAKVTARAVQGLVLWLVLHALPQIATGAVSGELHSDHGMDDLVEYASVCILYAVALRVKGACGEVLTLLVDQHILPSHSIVDAVLIQDLLARSPDEDVLEEFARGLLALVNQFEELLNRWLVDGERVIVGVLEELDLVKNIVCAIVLGRGRKQNGLPAFQEVPNGCVAL